MPACVDEAFAQYLAKSEAVCGSFPTDGMGTASAMCCSSADEALLCARTRIHTYRYARVTSAPAFRSDFLSA
eukprot:scaffold87717_cov21-Prasinocladus_malaysianus.AAC.1